MAPWTIGFGILLMALGGWGYLGAAEGDRSLTALIPAFFGLVLAVLGALAYKEQLRKHVMHAAAAVASLGLVLAVVGLIMGLRRTGGEVGRGMIASGGMALLCAIFVGLCVNSFIQARRARARAEGGQG